MILTRLINIRSMSTNYFILVFILVFNYYYRSMSRWVKRLRGNSLRKNKTIFGVSLLKNSQQYGQPLPLPLQYALQYLRRTSMNQQGIFRKSGVKTRITKLQQAMEANPEDIEVCFDDYSPYDIADVVKVYFRELPEPLMTTKLSQTFTSIFLGKLEQSFTLVLI